MTVILLILVSLGLVACLGYIMFGPHRTQTGARIPASHASSPEASVQVRAAAEAEVEKKRRELEEQKSQVQQLRAELKQVKRRLFDQRETEKDGNDLVKARVAVEHTASIQLEAVRAELSGALSELAKLKANQEGGKRRPAGAVALVSNVGRPLEMPVPLGAEPVTERLPEPDRQAKRPRELNDADRERIDRLEHQANKDRARSSELERELKRLKGRNETQHRVFVVTKGELDLVKDKFKALEKRLNRTLLEKDLLRRALKDLENKTGSNADRTELTADEIAASDRKVDERVQAEVAESERRASLAATVESEPPVVSPPPSAEPQTH